MYPVDHPDACVIGIDPSTKTALAVIKGGALVHTAQLKTLPVDTMLIRSFKMAQFILETVQEYQPQIVVIEDYALNAKFRLVDMVVIGTCIRVALYQSGVRWYDVAPSDLKLWLTGKGNAKKGDMIAHVASKFGFVTKNDDIADAVALAKMGEAIYFTRTCEGIDKRQVIPSETFLHSIAKTRNYSLTNPS